MIFLESHLTFVTGLKILRFSTESEIICFEILQIFYGSLATHCYMLIHVAIATTIDYSQKLKVGLTKFKVCKNAGNWIQNWW